MKILEKEKKITYLTCWSEFQKCYFAPNSVYIFVNFHFEVGLHDKFHQMMNVIDKWYLWQKKKTKWFQGYTCYLFKLFHACSQAPMLGDFIDLSTWTCLKINFYAPTDDLSTFCFWEHGTIVFNFTFINLRLNKPWKDFCNMCQNISSSGVTEIYLSLYIYVSQPSHALNLILIYPNCMYR